MFTELFFVIYFLILNYAGEGLSKLWFNHLMKCYSATTHDFHQGLLMTYGTDRKLSTECNLHCVKNRVHRIRGKETGQTVAVPACGGAGIRVLSCGLLCVCFASSPLPLLSKVSIIGPRQMEQQREMLLKSGKRTCIR